MRFLIVDDSKSNIEVLKLLVEEWMEENNYEFETIDEVYDGLQAVNRLKESDYDIVFLDIMMPVMDGLEALEKIRKLDIEQSIIIVVTALEDDKTKQKAKNLKANAYITKPVKKIMIDAMLSRYIPTIIDTDFFDLDDEFEDLDEDSIKKKQLMDKFNASHKKIDAKTFLSEYENIEYILDDFEDLEHEIDDLYFSIDLTNLEEKKEEVSVLFDKYSSFLNIFSEFYELSVSLKILSDIIYSANFSNFSDKDKGFIVEFIKAIFKDLGEWKEHVFISQDAVDVFYINASSLNSCIQLEKFIKSRM